MNRLYIVLIIISIGLVGLLAFANKDSTSSEMARQQSSWASTEAEMAKGAQLIDVRTPPEYNDVHIENAINLSLQEIQAGKLPTASKETPIYVYCKSGNRSAEATSRLKAAGYKKVTDLGGIANVQSLGAKVTNE